MNALQRGERSVRSSGAVFVPRTCLPVSTECTDRRSVRGACVTYSVLRRVRVSESSVCWSPRAQAKTTVSTKTGNTIKEKPAELSSCARRRGACTLVPARLRARVACAMWSMRMHRLQSQRRREGRTHQLLEEK